MHLRRRNGQLGQLQAMGEEQSARLGVGGGAVPLLPGGPQGGSEMRRTSGNVRRRDRTGRTRGLRIRFFPVPERCGGQQIVV